MSAGRTALSILENLKLSNENLARERDQFKSIAVKTSAVMKERRNISAMAFGLVYILATFIVSVYLVYGIEGVVTLGKEGYVSGFYPYHLTIAGIVLAAFGIRVGVKQLREKSNKDA